MWGKKRHSMQVLNILHTDTVVEGNIQTASSIRIDGELCGSVESERNIIIGKKARVTGDIKGGNVTLEGYVQGNVYTKEHLQLTSTSQIYGDISYKSLEIEPGAVFVGTSRYDFEKADVIPEKEHSINKDEHQTEHGHSSIDAENVNKKENMEMTIDQNKTKKEKVMEIIS